MKKQLLSLMAIIMLCIGTMNADVYIKLPGEHNDWDDYNGGIQYTGEPVTFTGIKNGKFKVQVWTGSENKDYGTNSGLNVGETYNIPGWQEVMWVNGATAESSYNVKVSWDANTGVTLTVVDPNAQEVEINYVLHGQIYDANKGWYDYPMTYNEQDGTWVLDRTDNLIGSDDEYLEFGIKQLTDGNQTAWIGPKVNGRIEGAGTFLAKVGGNFKTCVNGCPAKFVFNPETMELVVETSYVHPDAYNPLRHFKQTVYFENAGNWEGTIKCYAWNGGTNNAAFPGQSMTQIEGTNIWTITFDDTYYNKVIFSNKNDGNSQTANYNFVHGNIYTFSEANNHNDYEGVAHQLEAHAATQVIVEGEGIEVDHTAGTITGKVAKAEGADNAEFTVKFAAAEGHVIMYRHITSGGAQNAVATGISGHTVAADGESLTLPVGEGSISVATFDKNTGMVHQPVVYSYAVSEDTSGIENIAVDAAAEAVYYNLQGVRVAAPAAGTYIRVVNGTATKVRL